jgi:hypothetical protein
MTDIFRTSDQGNSAPKRITDLRYLESLRAIEDRLWGLYAAICGLDQHVSDDDLWRRIASDTCNEMSYFRGAFEAERQARMRGQL